MMHSETKELLAELNIARNFVQKMASKEPSEKSRANYKKTVNYLLKCNTDPLSHAKTQNSFYLYRAAWIYCWGQKLKRLLKLNEQLQQENHNAWRKNLEQIKMVNALLVGYEPDPRRENRDKETPGAWTKKFAEQSAKDIKPLKSSSKKASIQQMKTDYWRERVFLIAMSNHSKFAEAIACLSISGCRPAEIEKGILCQALSKGGLKVIINGAKTHDGKFGAKRRGFVINDDSLEYKYLYQAALISGSAGLTIIAKAKSVSDAVSKISKALWPASKGQAKQISAYSFRHQLSADLKAQGYSAEDIAKIMGHSTDQSQTYYSAGKSGGGGRRITEIESTREVTMKNAKSLKALKTKQAAAKNASAADKIDALGDVNEYVENEVDKQPTPF